MDSKECTKCGEAKTLDRFRKARKSLRASCRDCDNASTRIWKAKNKSLVKEINQSNYRKNKDAICAKNKRWAQDNPELFRVRAATRRVDELNRTVSWANDQLIAAYYKEAKRLEELTGIKFHVDHIIPLRGELVSGLHVETNLQLLPAHENLGKSNSFDPELFCA